MQAHQLDRFQYYDKDFLGKGSFGKVFKGKDTTTQQEVAIKIMDMTLFDDEYMLESLKKEISIMKELQHPHIVRMLDVFGNKKETIIIIELCDGGDLRGFMQKHGGMLDEGIAQNILQQLMAGFQEMTNRGYIHRDIKPENSLINKGIHKVADFGFATKADITGRLLLQDCVGTPLYMAPQLLENVPYSAKCDIWSIGIMAYEMIYGRQPWPCRDCNSYLFNIKCQPLKFPYDKQISEQYKDFIRRCLTVQEDKRIGWNEVFKHPVLIISQNERQYQKGKEIDAKSRAILANIQKIVQARGLDVNQQFQQFDQDQGGSLDQGEFYQFLNQLDPRITNKESVHLFGMFDNNGDGKMTIDEFRNMFCSYDFADINDIASRIITDLKEIIKANNLSIADIFKNFDLDKQGDLDIEEFTKLIKVIAPAIKEYEVGKIFQKFDKNNDKKISFEEFKRELSYATDQDSQFNPKREKAMKLISELRRIVQQNQVPINQIFANFDKNKDQKLDFMEFKKLCEVMDKSLVEDEQQLVFQIVDSKHQQYLDYPQFEAIFK